MKKSSIALAAVAAGLFVLAAACQQSEKGKGSAKWHLSPAPSTSAGYGASPFQQEPRQDTVPAAPGYDNEIPAGATEEKKEEQPAAAGYGPSPATPTWKIEPPPSAAGYGK